MSDPLGPSPHATLETRASSRTAIALLLVWCAVEGVASAIALQPTMGEVLSDLTGLTAPPIVLDILLGVFLTIIVAGSFACMQTLKEAIKAKQIGKILNMTLVQVVVAMFQVLFLYGPLVDATAPWLAQGGVALGRVGTLALASCGWVTVRGLTWLLLGRAGAPALLALLNRPTSR